MFASYILGAVTALAVGAMGQSSATVTQGGSSSSTSSATSSASSGPATHLVAVGAEGFKFSPSETEANPGDIVRFTFYPGGHSVVRSDFKHACIPYEYAGLHRTGFYSGTESPQVVSNDLPTFDVKINDTDPIFYYCVAPGSCDEHHMIGVINPSKTETFAIQMQFAQNATFQLAPGDPWPSETAGEQPTETAGSDTANNTASPTATADPQSSGTHLSAGAIAGIAIGGAAVIILAAALIYLCGRRGGFDKAYRKSVQPYVGAASPHPSQGPMAEHQQQYVAGGIPAGAGMPKSPGQTSFSTYSVPPGEHDPYRSMTTSPQNPYFNNGHTPPPQMQQGMQQGYPSYQSTISSHQGVHSPLMGELAGQQQNYQPMHEQHQYQAPVELPTSVGSPIQPQPGSPPPQYPQQPDRRDSWTMGSEGQFVQGNKR
ncbi:hypothetical protein B0H66DRAFT_4382 [Apodospora peruviana]|uniref:Extracellular serine-rich protein n=1 Tax=Apodospora peruviana TaxID=516989 RepID=A0AAE0ME36_9PEZI|nr:hypothetical protein B0H66DRAFT_4382 [Apodospora peruviana]